MKHTIYSSSILLALIASSTGALIQVDFTTSIIGTGTSWDDSLASGSLFYEDTLVPLGNPTDPPIELFAPDATLTLEAFGQTFTHEDDMDFPLFPVITFQPEGTSFTSLFIFDNVATSEISSFELSIGPNNVPLNTSGTASAFITVVPEPSVSLLLLGSLSFTLRRRR